MVILVNPLILVFLSSGQFAKLAFHWPLRYEKKRELCHLNLKTGFGCATRGGGGEGIRLLLNSKLQEY